MFSDFEVCLLNLYERLIRFYDIYIHELIVKIEKYTKKCTILQFKVFTINKLWTGDADLHLYITTVQDG